MENIFQYREKEYSKTKFLFFWSIYYKYQVIWKLIFSKQFIFIKVKITDSKHVDTDVNRFQLSVIDSGRLMEILGKEYREYGEYSESIENLKL